MRKQNRHNRNFNPRSRVGNDGLSEWRSTSPKNFNPRSRVGNDNCLCVLIHSPWKFQSTFPRGERLPFVPDPVVLRKFQSTFPRGERRVNLSDFHAFCHFNPRSRVGNDFRQASIIVKRKISIHVPAWGTTPRPLLYSCLTTYFNPRSRVGNDELYPVYYISISISIHVPAWGTTVVISWLRTGLIYFNPRSRVGNDRLKR